MASEKSPLEGKRIAILATDGVEESELVKPREALDAAGAETVLVSPKKENIQAFKHHDKAHRLEVDLALAEADASAFDALLLPGGALNPDSLRTDPKAIAFVQAFARAGKAIAAICHGPWLLVEAGLVSGRTVTSWPSIQTDLKNAGANWVDQEVVVDGGLITSRKPADIPAFARTAIEEFARPPHHAALD
jgi:protease I